MTLQVIYSKEFWYNGDDYEGSIGKFRGKIHMNCVYDDKRYIKYAYNRIVDKFKKDLKEICDDYDVCRYDISRIDDGAIIISMNCIEKGTMEHYHFELYADVIVRDDGY